MMQRCTWCLGNDAMVKYHDEEWGVPLHDDYKQFEFLMMEVMQCGLNWNMMIAKREIFRQCFAEFDFDQVADFEEADILRILDTPGMIKSRRKIAAIIHNAKCFQQIRVEYGSFSQYLWAFTDDKTILYAGHEKGNIPAHNGLSDKISSHLKKRGFKYLGGITVYSHLQACGIINDHTAECFCYQEIVANHPICHQEPDQEP